ncbi:disease resistance protein RUN1-like [Eucalyptus grandis]|uniref:disease resistance protein RUN1-like n=1 Tax=Eucalyptus grandis TaxID=71139 RepID=UPI00192E87CD|nr:disease resistance protein RUN1-like [Eucalyptus grandis]
MDIQDSRNCGQGSSETRENDVFFSFSGQDDCNDFVDHLYRSLRQAEISVLRDDDQLAVGEEKGPSLTQAIRHSKIAIPILSENYLSSMSCRAKLAQIVKCHKCHKTTGQIIMPVFFNVSPAVVKKGSSDYEKVIARHRQEDPKTLQEWKKALIHLGSISGGTSNRSGTDASLIDELVANVLRALNRYLVDIEHDVERVMELLDEKSSDVRVVGIHGIRGTGKTTIAKLICTRMFRQFDDRSFLESVREYEERQLGLKFLQHRLFSDLLGETHGQISSFEERIKLLKDQFVCMKFLIVLDDVGASFQLEQILRNPDWLGSEAGS